MRRKRKKQAVKRKLAQKVKIRSEIKANFFIFQFLTDFCALKLEKMRNI
jgi:hypothetical protein